jgi:hypothetical protein
MQALKRQVWKMDGPGITSVLGFLWIADEVSVPFC